MVATVTGMSPMKISLLLVSGTRTAQQTVSQAIINDPVRLDMVSHQMTQMVVQLVI